MSDVGQKQFGGRDLSLPLLPDDITLVIAICGATNGGKTTLANKLLKKHSPVTIIHQDDFYKEDDQVPVSEGGNEKLWDVVEALNVEKIVQAVKTVKSGTVASSKELETKSQCSEFPYLRHLVVIEGTMILNIRELRPLLNAVYFITLDYDTMKERRSKRDYVGEFPDHAGYFEDCVWPSYMRDMKKACSYYQEGHIRMLDGKRDILENLKEIEIDISTKSLFKETKHVEHY